MPLTVRKRQEPWVWGSFFILPVAIACSLAAGALMLALQGKPALEGIFHLVDGAFGAGYALVDTLLKAVPIFLCGLGVAVSFRMQVWNIGAEGQFAMGAIGATWAALAFPSLPALLLLPLMFVCGGITGGGYALVAAFLRVRFRVNEIISTLMLNYIAILFLDFLVYGPWKDKRSHGFPMTPEFSPAAILPRIGDTRIHWGVAVCVLCGLIVWVVLRKTRAGFEIEVSGYGQRPARYAGIPYNALVCAVMAACGVLAGFAGLIETSAVLNKLQPSVIAGYGYTAIVVAWLARLNPLAIALASFLLAGLRVGVENLQLSLQVPAAFGGILEGLILITVLGGQFFRNYRIVWRKE